MNAVTQRTHGFSLVEVVIAVGVLAMIMLSTAGVIVRSQQTTSQTAGQTGATQLLTGLSSNIQRGVGKYTPDLPDQPGRMNTYTLTSTDIADLFANQAKNDYGNADLYSATVSNLGLTTVNAVSVVKYSVKACYVNTFAESGDRSCLTQNMYGPRPSVTRSATGTNVAVTGNDTTPTTPTNPGQNVPRGDLKIIVTDEFSGENAPTVTITGENFSRSVRAYTSGYTLTAIPAGTYTVTVTPSSARQTVTADPPQAVTVPSNQAATVTIKARKAKARVVFSYTAGETLETNLRVTLSNGENFNMICTRSCDQIRYLDVGTTYTIQSENPKQKARIDEYNAPFEGSVSGADTVHRIEVRSFTNPVSLKQTCTWDDRTVPCRDLLKIEIGPETYYSNKDVIYNGKATWQYRVSYENNYQQGLAGTTVYQVNSLLPVTGMIGDGVDIDVRMKAFYNNVSIVFAKAFPENMPAMTAAAQVGNANFNINSTEPHVMSSVPGAAIKTQTVMGEPFTIENRTWRYVMTGLDTAVATSTTPYTVQVKRQQSIGGAWVDSSDPLTTPPPPPPPGDGGIGPDPDPNPDPDPDPDPNPEPDPEPDPEPPAPVDTTILYTFKCGVDNPTADDGDFVCDFYMNGPMSYLFNVPKGQSVSTRLQKGYYNVEASLTETRNSNGGFLTYGSFENIGSVNATETNNTTVVNGKYVYQSCSFWFCGGAGSGTGSGGGGGGGGKTDPPENPPYDPPSQEY